MFSGGFLIEAKEGHRKGNLGKDDDLKHGLEMSQKALWARDHYFM